MIRFERVAEYPSRGWANRLSVRTDSGREASAHAVLHLGSHTRVRLMRIEPPRPVAEWSRQHQLVGAINGGFSIGAEHEPVGEQWVEGRRLPSRPFPPPWDEIRGAISMDGDEVRIGPRRELVRVPKGDLLQAGPLLVHGGKVVVSGDDPEGFSSASSELGRDITAGPQPRSCIGVTDDGILALVVDGSSADDPGLTLAEVAELLVQLGATAALNLDGGPASALIVGSVMRNRARPAAPTATALAFVRSRGG